MHSRQFNLLLGLLLSLLTLQATAKKDQPDIISTPFEGKPGFISYFEDSDVVLVLNVETGTVYRSADGGSGWKPLDDMDEGAAVEVLRHPYDNKVAVILGGQKRHWITRDRGESWDHFETEGNPPRFQPGINFHADNVDRMLYLSERCDVFFSCETSVYYTTDGFKSPPRPLPKEVSTCIWAKSTDVFTTGDKERDENTIVCIAQPERFSYEAQSTQVLVSDDFFKTDGVEPVMSDGRTVQGVTNIAPVKRYIVFAAKSERTIELSMQVTTDTVTWHRAELGEHKLVENAYTLLESTNYSMQVDVINSTSPVGILLTSESNGTFFTKSIEHTNRNPDGLVDFEKVSNIQGIVILNVVDNWEDLEHRGTKKKLKSKISFDDGRTWSPLRAGEESLHLHSVTEQKNIGRIFSSPAPGIVMGIGNTGEYLRDYDEGDLYVSHDAGLKWTLAKERPHLYEFGASGSVLVATENGETDEIQWSLDYGKNWQTTKLDYKVTPKSLTTTPDSTSLKFLMTATSGRSPSNYSLIALDFNNLHERECGKSDLEDWYASVYDNGSPQCIMGHKQSFRRRKLDADCLVVAKKFEDLEMTLEDCECTKADFECAYDFVREEGENGACVPIKPIVAPEGACKEGEDKFKGPSGYRLIPGNTCKRDGGEQLDKEEKEWNCDQSKEPKVGSGKVTSKKVSFKGGKFVEYNYLENVESNQGHDETIIMLTDRKEVYITSDHGKNWRLLLEDTKYDDEKVVLIYPHQYINEFFYLITESKKVIYSKNRGERLQSFEAPELPNTSGLQHLQFHPTEHDWLIWTGRTDCESGSQDCLNVAHVSKKGGDDWEILQKGVRKCLFVYRKDERDSEKLIYCEHFENEDPHGAVSLLSSDDWFVTKKELKRDVINYATMAEYIVVAVRDEDKKSLKVDASIDGITFADAQFPHNFHVDHQQAYTVLDSSTHAVFLHVTVNNEDDREYGSILKSNSNGTSYVLSASEVNRNTLGFVDFEKTQGLEGVALINRVADPSGSGTKKLKTYITHNDGAGWALLPRPTDPPKDLGEPFKCTSSGEKCSLHLHGYTERKDPRMTYSSPNAVGMMIATGNVGEFLEPKKEADTFITTDAGITWNFIQKGNWLWEFGDQGSVIVIVKAEEATRSVLYTLDEGASWAEYEFDEERMEVESITTVPSDTSLNFLLWGRINDKLVTINLDFSGLSERTDLCKLDEKDPESQEGDYRLWHPRHPLRDDDCLFGHITSYHRKKVDRKCYNGPKIPHLHATTHNCTCTREDYECDYNFEPDNNGKCSLVEGAKKPNPADVCAKDPSLVEYNDITGYRRIPLTTCHDGRELDYLSKKLPCPNHEEEYRKKHSISGAGLFFAITLPIAAAAGFGYWVYRSWDGKFGRIRLGDPGSASGHSLVFFDRDAPWIRYPVLALSGVIAVIAALPMLVGSLWRTVSTRLGRRGGGGGLGARAGYSARPFTSRSSFARGRGNYAVIDPDDAELLGDESDEET